MKILNIDAPAKINLCLHVRGRRADGYHELAMAMQQVDLCDRVRIALGDGSGVNVHCDGLELGGTENIASRAARLFLSEVHGDHRVEIEIDKRIPVAAGLGGGSSDAAAVLDGLNRLYDHPLSRERLMALGAELGADVPFFLFGPTAWATGTGTVLEPLPSLPKVCYLLLNPGFAVSTAWVYESLRLTKGGELANLPRFSAATTEALLDELHNDLEAVTAQQYPEIGQMKAFLVANGALGALMSGSGASVFGVFRDEILAREAAERALAETNWRVFVTHPLAAGATTT